MKLSKIQFTETQTSMSFSFYLQGNISITAIGERGTHWQIAAAAVPIPPVVSDITFEIRHGSFVQQIGMPFAKLTSPTAPRPVGLGPAVPVYNAVHQQTSLGSGPITQTWVRITISSQPLSQRVANAVVTSWIVQVEATVENDFVDDFTNGVGDGFSFSLKRD